VVEKLRYVPALTVAEVGEIEKEEKEQVVPGVGGGKYGVGIGVGVGSNVMSTVGVAVSLAVGPGDAVGMSRLGVPVGSCAMRFDAVGVAVALGGGVDAGRNWLAMRSSATPTPSTTAVSRRAVLRSAESTPRSDGRRRPSRLLSEVPLSSGRSAGIGLARSASSSSDRGGRGTDALSAPSRSPAIRVAMRWSSARNSSERRRPRAAFLRR
jgi:hypothetical protein